MAEDCAQVLAEAVYGNQQWAQMPWPQIYYNAQSYGENKYSTFRQIHILAAVYVKLKVVNFTKILLTI